jgi:hypothetical protein
MSQLITFGHREGDRLGRPAIDNTPIPLTFPPSTFIKLVALGWQHGHAVTMDDNFYSWGTGESWQLATGTRTSAPTPILIDTFPPDFTFRQVECGEKFGAAIDTHGTLLVWGAGYGHRPGRVDLPGPASYIAAGPVLLAASIGDGSVVVLNRRKPIKHVHVPPGESVVMVACGSANVLALSQTGRAFIWGGERLGAATISESPQLVAMANPIVLVFGYSNFWLVDNENRLFGFGRNESFSLGVDDADVKETPVCCDAFRGTAIKQVAMGSAFTLVLTGDGRVFACGKLSQGLSGRAEHPADFVAQNFIECDRFSGKNVSQIACGLNHAAVLIDGLISPSALRLLPSFDDYPLPTSPVECMTVDGQSVMIDDATPELKKIGLFPGDVCQWSETERILVVGVDVADRTIAAVLRETQNLLTRISLSDINSKYPICGRRGSSLRAIIVGGRRIWIDQRTFFSGILPDDALQDGSKLLGTCGTSLYAQNGNDIRLVNLDSDCLTRRGRPLVRIQVFDAGDGQFVEELNELVLHRYYGVGVRYGSSYVRFLCDGRRARKVDEKSLILMSHGRMRLHTDGMECVSVDGSDPRALDLVKCPMGVGVVAGAVGNGRLAVWVGRHRTVSVIEEADVEPIARANGELVVDGGLSANCADFADAPVLPGDQMDDGVAVVGIADGRSQDGKIVEVNLTAGVRVRYMFAMCKRGGRYVSTFNFAGAP